MKWYKKSKYPKKMLPYIKREKKYRLAKRKIIKNNKRWTQALKRVRSADIRIEKYCKKNGKKSKKLCK